MESTDYNGEPTQYLGTKDTRLYVTPRGGHLWMEYRDAEGQWSTPYSLSPWTPEEHPDLPVLLQVLRGDFFCFPFGVTEGLAYPHGETANRIWKLEDSTDASATYVMDLESMPGRVTKQLDLDADARLFRQRHVIEGVDGVFNYGHHPILKVPEGQKAILSTGPFHFGQVYPNGFAVAEDGETGALKDGARFSSLDAVATADGGVSTLAEFPVRDGCEDLVLFAADSEDWAWNAFFIEGCLWLGFRKAADFPSTLYWMSNGGRAQPPWNARHLGRIGIEDVCSHFHDGAHVSSRDQLKEHGIPTARRFDPAHPVTVDHWQCVIPTELPPCKIERVEIGNGRLSVHPVGAEPIVVNSQLLK